MPSQDLNKQKHKITVATHSGRFHPDDLFAVATLALLSDKKGEDIDVVRTRDVEVISKCDYVVDVGGESDPSNNKFDHHQRGGAGKDNDSVPYAAFGLVWKKFGPELSGSEQVAMRVRQNLVAPIDYADNLGEPLSEMGPGIYPYTFSRMIDVLNEETDEPKLQDANFLAMLDFAKRILLQEIRVAQAIEDSALYIMEVYKQADDKRILVLDRKIPWFPVVAELDEPRFVIFPDNGSGNWAISTIRHGKYDFNNRLDFPASWAGLRDAELEKVTGIEGSVFCHNRLFFAVAKTKNSAYSLAKLALEANKVA
jgi:uncharacterized UPF0160 family protein